jgi:hypothetical protein
MAIDVTKILSMSAQDYVGPGNKVTDTYHVQEYSSVGRKQSTSVGTLKFIPGTWEELANKVPDEAEVCVGRQERIAMAGRTQTEMNILVCVNATALIPKNASERTPTDLAHKPFCGL